MENKKGSGIFLGVVSVATLVVAIIGATFAYFSASVTGDNEVTAEAYEFSASLSVTQVYPTSATSLIPLNPTATIENATAPNNTNLLYALNIAEDKCVDDAGFQVCALYQLDFVNNGADPITLAGKLTTVENTASTNRTGATPFANLTYNGVSGTTGNFTLDSNVGIDGQTLAADAEGFINIGSVTVPEKVGENAGTLTKYVLVYLNDNGDQSAEMGASYRGQLDFTSTAGDGNRLTGTFTVTGE